MALKLPRHAGDHLEAQARAWLIDGEAVGKADAFVGNFDMKMSVDFPGCDLDRTKTSWVGVFDRVGDEFGDQKPQGNGVVRRSSIGPRGNAACVRRCCPSASYRARS